MVENKSEGLLQACISSMLHILDFFKKSPCGIVPETTARSAVPGVSPGRGLLIPHGYLHPRKSEHSEV